MYRGNIKATLNIFCFYATFKTSHLRYDSEINVLTISYILCTHLNSLAHYDIMIARGWVVLHVKYEANIYPRLW